MDTQELCPNCGRACYRESVDVGIGVIYGPWGCPCGWSEDPVYDQEHGPTYQDGYRTDQWGWLYPTDLEPAGIKEHGGAE